MNDQLELVELGLGALPGFIFWRVAANSASVKPPEILIVVAFVVLQDRVLILIQVELTRGQHLRISRFKRPVMRWC